MAEVLIGLVFLLLVPGCINYGLVTGYRGWTRYISLLLFVGLPIIILIYLYFRQKAFAERSDYSEDITGAMLLFIAVPALVSGIVSGLTAFLALWFQRRKPKSSNFP